MMQDSQDYAQTELTHANTTPVSAPTTRTRKSDAKKSNWGRQSSRHVILRGGYRQGERLDIND